MDATNESNLGLNSVIALKNKQACLSPLIPFEVMGVENEKEEKEAVEESSAVQAIQRSCKHLIQEESF